MLRSILLVAALAAGAFAQTAPTTVPDERPATQPVDAGPAVVLPYSITRIGRAGPITGVVVKLDLTDPRVHVVTALADGRDPDGDGPAVGRLDTVYDAAIRNDFSLTINASFFAITGNRVAQGKRVGYFVGNGAWPVGFMRVDGKTIHEAHSNDLRACLIVHDDGHVSIAPDVQTLPDDARFAVSGNKVLAGGEVAAKPEGPRHPRTAVGLSADGKTLILLVIDGRRPFVSMGVTLEDEAKLLKEFGAADGINFDGGGSSTLVIKDAVTGVHAIANKPCEFYSRAPLLDSVQRPVVDVIGVRIDGE